jgi:spore maturation protein B
MQILLYLSDMIIPLMFIGIILYGISHKIKVYDTFIEGAKDGVTTVFNIFPTLIGLMVAVAIVNIG